MEEDNEINRKIGEILVKSISVENLLEHFILNHSIIPEHSEFFFEKLIQPLNFQRKRNLFNEICLKKGVPKNEIKKIINLIKDIQQTRNKVAHYETISNISTGRKHIVKRMELALPSTDLDKEYMDEFDKKIQLALSGISYFM